MIIGDLKAHEAVFLRLVEDSYSRGIPLGRSVVVVLVSQAIPAAVHRISESF